MLSQNPLIFNLLQFTKIPWVRKWLNNRVIFHNNKLKNTNSRQAYKYKITDTIFGVENSADITREGTGIFVLANNAREEECHTQFSENCCLLIKNVEIIYITQY